ncbi:AAA family ATPase [Lentzea nigeriaca]|uniref:AAA family ATPase n=1 Tax=Lentzea nigeriaca TaxID=1128665 RepID=UPI001EF8E7D5|nr:AAA family ATPase [Lentzea nigeriaca]MBM7861977.1 hypothetical protein [Lentzea nigeriaca]
MLIWINGPFGGGKTATAFELHRRLAGSVESDPEHVGFGLHRMLPPALRGDFQDLPAWRHGVHSMLDLALRGHDTDHRAHYIGRLRLLRGHRRQAARRRPQVHHFALMAEPVTVLRRLRNRGMWPGLKREGWGRRPDRPLLDPLREPEFGEHIATDHRTVAQVADTIARSVGLAITRTPTARCSPSYAGAPPHCATSGWADLPSHATVRLLLLTFAMTLLTTPANVFCIRRTGAAIYQWCERPELWPSNESFDDVRKRVIARAVRVRVG